MKTEIRDARLIRENTRSTMPIRITKSDQSLLTALANCRVLTIKQFAVLGNQHPNAIRRRLKTLRDMGLITATTRKSNALKGRPEQIIHITDEGFALVADTNNDQRQPKPIGSTIIEHQILQNWAYVQLQVLARQREDLTVDYRCPCSIALGPHAGRLIPDAAFTMSHGKKSLLFLLEVDRGTEPIGSTQHDRASIDGKCRDYVDSFHRETYRQLEPVFNATFKGFRVLFLCNTSQRMQDICRFLIQAGNLDFCWVADEHHLLEEGMAGSIWSRGGHLNRPPHSILGNLADPLRSQ